MRNTVRNLLALSLLCVGAVHAAPPAHDNILKAVKLPGNYTEFAEVHDLDTATAAVTDPVLGNAGGKTLWFSIPRPAIDGTLRLELKSSTAKGVAVVYEVMDPENPASSLYRIGGNQAFTNGNEFMFFQGTPVRQLMVMVRGTGKFQVRHRFASAEAPNDFPADAIALAGDKGTVYGNTTMATGSSDEPQMSLQSPDVANTVWYKWTPSFNGTAHLDTNFSYLSGSQTTASDADQEALHATVIGVFRGPLSAPIFTTSDASSGFGANSRVTFTATAGTTYTIGVSTLAGKTPGPFVLNYYRGNTGGEIYVVTPSGGDQYLTEQAKAVNALVRRRYAGDFASSCNVVTTDYTAKAVLDYVAVNQSITLDNSLSDTQWQKEVKITVVDDNVSELHEFFGITLTNVSANATLGVSLAYCDILNDDDAPESVLAGPATPIRVKENYGSLLIPIRRVVDSKAEEFLKQNVVNGSATSGADFILDQSATLSPYASETGVGFSLMDDNFFEPEETVKVHVNGDATYTVIIEDDDLYLPVPGKLTTALSYAEGARQAVLFATLSNVGAVTGKLIAVGKTVPFSGKLDTRGKLVVPIAVPGRAVFMLSLSAQDSEGTFKVDLLDGGTQQLSSKTVVMQSFAPKINPCPFAGTYTMNAPGGFGVQCSTAASIKVDAGGNVVMAGKVYDGTPYTASGFVDGAGYAGALASLYAGKGCVGLDGLLPLQAVQLGTVAVTVNRPSRSDDPTKAPPFAKTVNGTAYRYTPPAKGSYAMMTWDTGNGKATLSGNPLANSLVKALTITTSHVITAPADAEKLKLKLVPATGVFTGTVVLPGTTKAIPIFGTLGQVNASSSGTGWFFNGYYGGKISLTKP